MLRKTVWLLIISLVAALPLVAQNTDIEALAGINFNFANPGARSLGMGGAFLGLADDASAAEANPAGLTILRKTEISLEGRNYRNSQAVNVSGTFPNLVDEEFSSFSRRAEISFGSVVIPRGNYALAFYYHEPLGYTNAAAVVPITDAQGNVTRQVPNFFLSEGGGPVSEQECLNIRNQNPSNPLACVEYRLFPFVTAVDVELKTWGAAFAWKMGNLSLGVAGKYSKFSEGAFTFREDFFGNPNSIAVQATGKLQNGQLELKDETDITYSAGFKWMMSPNLSIGGVYKTGGEFDAPTFAQNVGGPFAKVADTTFHEPDIAGVGVSWRPVPVLTLNVDAVQVAYSNLTDNFKSINENLQVIPNAYEAKDVTEIHAGAEYFFATRIPFAVRGGWWRDPAHVVRYKGPLTAPEGVAAAILFPESQDDDHYSVGFGLAWPTFQLDAAYETSDRFKVGSLSAVFRF